jgi:hypothetical protein
MAGAPTPKLPSFPGPVAQAGGGFASALKPKAKAGNDEAAAAVDQLAEAGDAFGAREILARLNYRLPAVPMAGTPLLRSAFYFKEALRVALSPTGEALAPPRGVDVVRRGPEARRVQGLLRGVPHAPVRAPHLRAGGAGRARRVPPVRGVQRGRPGPRGAGGHHQRRRRGRTPPRGVGPRGRNAGRAPPREAARRQGGVFVDRGCDSTELPFATHLLQAFQSCVSLLRVPAGLRRRRGGGANAEAVGKIERLMDKPPPLPWRTMLASAGFVLVQASTFAESQAEALLKRIALMEFRVEKRGELVSMSAWQC